MPCRPGLLLLMLVLFLIPEARATHLYGADIYYEHISGNVYRVNLTLYGDCKGASFPFLNGARPQIVIYDGPTVRNYLDLFQNGPGVEVTPVCQRELNNTTCKNVNNTIPGITRYIYSATYDLGYKSANWRFRFDGSTPVPGASQNYIAGRSGDISNIQAGGNAVMALEARLNNVLVDNSSPQFTTIPTPFYCINIPQQYNHGAVDANNDSLDYALVPGLSGTNGSNPGSGTVAYLPPYSGTQPMSGDVSGWTFSRTTGQLDFTPTVANKYLIVNEVKEYRNGQLIGTSMREMTFIILANCTTTPSVSNIDTARTYKTGVFFESGRVTVCQTTDTARFAIVPTNRSGDTIDASVAGLPPGVTAVIYSNNTPRPLIVVNWQRANLAPGLYNFFVTYKDRGCPLTSQVTKAFTIRVVPPNELSGPVIIAPTNCYRRAKVEFAAILGMAPRTIALSQNGQPIKTYRDSTGRTISDSLYAGTYTVDILSDDLECPTRRTFVVIDSGQYPHGPNADDRFHCLNDPPSQLTARADSGGVASWYLPDGTQLPQAPTPQTGIAGRTFYLVSQQVRVCQSPKDTVWVYVTKRPVASISGDQLRCEYDTGVYVFNGSIGEGPILEYIWNWDRAYYKKGEGPGPWSVSWGLSGTKYITLQVLENKCPSDTARLEIKVRPTPYAGFEMQPEVCQEDLVNIRYLTSPIDSQTFLWSFGGATPAESTTVGPTDVRWLTPGTKRVTLTAALNGCADTRFKDIIVHETPDIRILNVSTPVCIGEKIYLQATGARSYTWHPEDSMRNDIDGIYTHILKPSEYRVIGRNEWNCRDSASIEYPYVENCCNFGYPNAFTPNGDGRNDRFNVLSYGNHLDYELSIYNRWGQRVYVGTGAKDGWDGSFGGRPCDAGTYYYYFSALCYTGHREIHKGDVILIR